MASGRTHATATKLLIAPVALLAYVLGNQTAALYAAAGCWLGLLIEPDLDIATRTYSERRVLMWNRPLGVLWITIWTPYGQMIRHRSFWSHAPIIGTALRITYLLTPFTIFAAFSGFIVVLEVFATPQFLWLFFGLCMADTGHFVLDVVWSKSVKKFRSRR